MKSSPSVGLPIPEPSLKRVDSDPAREEILKGFLLYFGARGGQGTQDWECV